MLHCMVKGNQGGAKVASHLILEYLDRPNVISGIL